MRNQTLQDLVTHVNDKHGRAITQAVELLDCEHEIRAFLFAITASTIASLAEALSDQDELHPAFARLPVNQQIGVVMSLLALMLEQASPSKLSVQERSDALAAAREVAVKVKLALL